VISFKIPQLLSSGPKTIDELSQEAAIPRYKLERVLLALETEKIFDYKQDTKQFSLNSISSSLLNEVYADFIKVCLSPVSFDLLSALPDCLKLDKTAPEVRYDATFYDFVGQKPDFMQDFLCGSIAFTKWVSDEILPAIDLSNANKVLQVGGDGPELIIQLAKRYKNFNGSVYDLTLYRQANEKCIHECQLSDRIKVMSGNYVDSLPEGFDTVVMKFMSLA